MSIQESEKMIVTPLQTLPNMSLEYVCTVVTSSEQSGTLHIPDEMMNKLVEALQNKARESGATLIVGFTVAFSTGFTPNGIAYVSALAYGSGMKKADYFA